MKNCKLWRTVRLWVAKRIKWKKSCSVSRHPKRTTIITLSQDRTSNKIPMWMWVQWTQMNQTSFKMTWHFKTCTTSKQLILFANLISFRNLLNDCYSSEVSDNNNYLLKNQISIINNGPKLYVKPLDNKLPKSNQNNYEVSDQISNDLTPKKKQATVIFKKRASREINEQQNRIKNMEFENNANEETIQL